MNHYKREKRNKGVLNVDMSSIIMRALVLGFIFPGPKAATTSCPRTHHTVGKNNFLKLAWLPLLYNLVPHCQPGSSQFQIQNNLLYCM